MCIRPLAHFFMGCYLLYLLKSYAFTLWGWVYFMIAVTVDWSWALMLGSGISVRADDRKTLSENMYQFI